MTLAFTDDPSLEHLLRDLAPQVLGAVVRRHTDFAAADDAVQDALIAAATQWPADGLPANPRGWLYHVALRRLTDRARSETARQRRESVAATEAAIETVVPALFGELDAEEDDSLTLLFMCCHPALTPPSSIALTLRAVGGLTTAEIAAAFLVPEATMGQRISRARHSIRTSGIPFAQPTDAERAERLDAVRRVIYLIFNEGYVTRSGPALQRADLATEAIRLARLLARLAPEDAETDGLLALLLLTDARRGARTGAHGQLIPLDEQDRSLWNRPMIAEGLALVAGALRRARPGPHQVQAAIAALHDEASAAGETDWPQILALYDVLLGMSDNPMVALNRAIAVAMVDGPAAGLAQLAALDADPRIATHHRLDAVRGHLLAMRGEHERAAGHFRAAAERTLSIPERDYLRMKAAALEP